MGESALVICSKKRRNYSPDKSGDDSRAERNSRVLAGAKVVHEEPGQSSHRGGNVGDHRGLNGAEVDGELRSSVETEPSAVSAGGGQPYAQASEFSEQNQRTTREGSFREQCERRSEGGRRASRCRILIYGKRVRYSI